MAGVGWMAFGRVGAGGPITTGLLVGRGVNLGVGRGVARGVGVGLNMFGCEVEIGGLNIGANIGAIIGAIIGAPVGLSRSIKNTSSFWTATPVSCELSGVIMKITEPAPISTIVAIVSVKALFPLLIKFRLNVILKCYSITPVLALSSLLLTVPPCLSYPIGTRSRQHEAP